MYQTVLVNVTLAWVFAVALVFFYSKNDFEQQQVERVSSTLNNFTVLSDLIPNQSENQELAELLSTLRGRRDAREKDIARHNRRLFLQAVGIGVALIGLSVLFTIKEVKQNSFGYKSAVLGVGVGVALLITEVLLYLILFRTYDYGTEEHIYRAVSKMTKSLAC